MKEKCREIAEYTPDGRDAAKGIGSKGEKRESWGYDTLDPQRVIANLPIMTKGKGMNVRIQLPIHESTEIIATMIREKNPGMFNINLDVYRSMLYAGRQVFEWLFLGHASECTNSKMYKLAKVKEEIELVEFYEKCLDGILKGFLEGHLSHGTGDFSRDKILAKIEEIKPYLSKNLLDKVDDWVESELDAEITQTRVKERLRKREQRERKKNMKLIEGGKN